MPKIYTAYDTPPHTRIEYGESMTRQSEAAACDINNIVKKYKVTGVLPFNKGDPIYADVAEMGDYRTAIEQVRLADMMFLKLPSGIRANFDNDPAAFLDFVSDEDNRPEMENMGLIQKPVVAADAEPAETATEKPPEAT